MSDIDTREELSSIAEELSHSRRTWVALSVGTCINMAKAQRVVSYGHSITVYWSTDEGDTSTFYATEDREAIARYLDAQTHR